VFTGTTAVYENVKSVLDLEKLKTIYLNSTQGIDFIKLYRSSKLDLDKEEFV
jgi:hypothetical protein